MGNNDYNDMVPAVNGGSGAGSGAEVSSRNLSFGKKLRERRELFGFTQVGLANKLGCDKGTIQNWEAGSLPKGDYAIALAELLECSLDWLLMNSGPKPGPPGREKQTDKPGPLYNKVEALDMYVAAPGVEYNDGLDDFGRAVSGLKDIFNSGDPVLIPAIQANIHAFQISVRRETHIQEQTKEISDLKKRLDALERHIKEGDRRKGERRLEDLEPPDGVEHRSGSERRKYAAGE